MIKAQITVTGIITDKGTIRIVFEGGGNYFVPDTMDNIGIRSALEVEIKHAAKKLQKSE